MLFTARVTGNAEVKETKSGKKVVNFSVAINDRYKKDGEWITATTFIDCSYWVNPGIGEYLRKGELVELFGRMGVNAWVNKDGEAKASLTCHINNIKLLGSPNKGNLEKAFSNAVNEVPAYN